MKREPKLDELDREVKLIRQENTRLQSRLEEVETTQRVTTVIFSANSVPEYRAGEVTATDLVTLTKEKLNLIIQPEAILSAYRMGNPSNLQGPDRRRIAVKFFCIENKKQVTEVCKSLRPSGLYVNENLTQLRSSVLLSPIIEEEIF